MQWLQFGMLLMVWTAACVALIAGWNWLKRRGSLDGGPGDQEWTEEGTSTDQAEAAANEIVNWYTARLIATGHRVHVLLAATGKRFVVVTELGSVVGVGASAAEAVKDAMKVVRA